VDYEKISYWVIGADGVAPLSTVFTRNLSSFPSRTLLSASFWKVCGIATALASKQSGSLSAIADCEAVEISLG